MRKERYKRYAQSKREDIPIPGDHLRKAINILIFISVSFTGLIFISNYLTNNDKYLELLIKYICLIPLAQKPYP